MASKSTIKASVVVPNWNGKDTIKTCLDSLLQQTLPINIIVVENGSVDGSLGFLNKNYPDVEVLVNATNLGFSGGVNTGIRRSIERGDDFVALFNNDAIADTDWFENLFNQASSHPNTGIVACKLISEDKKRLDSTGEEYTSWGLSYPRGRDELEIYKYDSQTDIFAASGGASLYRISMLMQIGLFDEDFFAYYEDVDISFRAQLSGWKIRYAPNAVAYHQIGMTSGRLKGFTTYQTMKNIPLLFWKNVPSSLWFGIWPRFTIAYGGFMFSALRRGHGTYAIKGFLRMLTLLPKKTVERWRIQKNRKVPVDYISSILTYDLPPSARKLRKLRDKWRKLIGRGNG